MTDRIGHYRLLETVGHGSLGTVYRARDTRLGRTVAIKLSAALDASVQEAMLRDARSAAQVSHSGIATLFESGVTDDRVFLVFEFVPGETLGTLIGSRPLNPRTAIDIATQLADALAEGHRHEIVHGDLGPSAVLVTRTGRAKILDFGLARWRRPEHPRGSNPPGDDEGPLVAEWMTYRSPEQLRGDPVDWRCDIFALGVLLYEMVTGRPPFAGSTPIEIRKAVTETVPVPPSRLVASLPAALDAVIARTMAKAPHARYASAAACASALRALATRLARQRDVGQTPTVARSSGTPTGFVAALVALAVVIGLAIAWLGSRLQ